MHQAARDWIARHAPAIEGRVVEFGSRYVNGRVRDLFDVDEYHGIDSSEGEDVDEVTDLIEWKTRKKWDAVVCCEVLEHTPDPEGVIRSAARALRKDAVLLLTCATDPREPHSWRDGADVQDDEHYANIDPEDLAGWCEEHELDADIEVHKDRGDLYCRAVKQ